jgi:hypothetical protein
VLVQGDQRAEDPRGEDLGEQHVGRPVALHHPVRHHVLGRPLGPDLLLGLAEGQRLRLGEHVGGQDVVVVADRVQRLAKPIRSTGMIVVPWWMSW